MADPNLQQPSGPSGAPSRPPARVVSFARVLGEALLLAAAGGALAFAVNAARSDGLPLVPRQPFALFVPCPDATGAFESISAADAGRRAGALFVDARDPGEFAAWHPAGALSVPYDYIEPLSAQAVEAVLRSGAAQVVVYGDGAEPDSGRELAKELASRGVRNVFHAAGGAAALRAGEESGAPARGGGPEGPR